MPLESHFSEIPMVFDSTASTDVSDLEIGWPMPVGGSKLPKYSIKEKQVFVFVLPCKAHISDQI